MARAESHGQDVVNHQCVPVKNARTGIKIGPVETKEVGKEEVDIQAKVEEAVQKAVAAALVKERSKAIVVGTTKVAPTVVLTEIAADEE